MPFEQLGGGLTIERNALQIRQDCDPFRKRIGGDGIALDVGIKTTGPLGGRQHVPDGNTRLRNRPATLGIRQLGIEVEQRGHHRPKGISWVPVILLCL